VNLKITGLLILFLMLMGSPAYGIAWQDSNYNWTFNITIPAGKVTANLTSFPLLVSVTMPELIGANAGGSDILFKDADNITLVREIEFFNVSNGQLIAWVNTSLNTLGTVIYVYFNSTESNANSKYVFNATFTTVQHLNGTDNETLKDSTNYGNNITNSYGNPTYNNLCKIYRCVLLDGTDDYLAIPHNTTMNTGGAGKPFTVSIWANRTVSGFYRCLFMKQTSGSDGWRLLTHDAFYGFMIGGTGWDTLVAPTMNIWHLITLVYDGANARVYYDDYLNYTKAGANLNPDSTAVVSIGAMSFQYPGYEFGGYVEEFRLENINRSASWVNASYHNQNNPAGFMTIGTVSAPIQPEITFNISFVNPTPADNSTHGFDYNGVINMSKGNTSYTDFKLEWAGVNHTLTNGIYTPTLVGGTKYSYIGYANTTGQVNSTERRTLYIVPDTESNIANRIGWDSVPNILIFIIIIILILAIVLV